jgi:hypothetical protein
MDIPDHTITSPFTGRADKSAQHERFEKHRELIVAQFREIYEVGRHSHRPWSCDICGARIGHSTQTAILQHLGSMKHLRASGVLE